MKIVSYILFCLTILIGMVNAQTFAIFQTAKVIPYLGVVATRSAVAATNTLDTTNRQYMSRSTHIARANISDIRILDSNFFVNTTTRAENGSGSSATIAASVEYPVGICTQILYSGSASGSIPDAGTLLSDAIGISIPSGATFWVRRYWSSSTAVIYGTQYFQTAGDSLRVGVSGVPNQTISCDAITNLGGGVGMPLGIISMTTSPTACLLGDSITFGTTDAGSASGDVGMVARSVGPTIGYANLGVESDSANAYNASHAGRAVALAYCSHKIVGYGSNDFAGGASAATVEARLTTLYSSLGSDARIFQNTILPRPSTSNGCTTLGGQSLPSWEAEQLILNDALKAGSFGPNKGMFDTSGAVETSTDSGFWKTSPSQWSLDCIHPVTFGAAQIAASGAIDVARIILP